MKRLKGKAQSQPQYYLCLLPAALNWSGSLNGSNSRRLLLILMSHLQTRQRVKSHRAASKIWWPRTMTLCFLLFFFPPLSLFCVLILLTQLVQHRKLSDASRPLSWTSACVSSHGWTCDFKGNVNNLATDGAAWLLCTDHAYTFQA